jgi:IS1 family transposase
MNKLPVTKRAQILSMLCEGSSMRSVSRLTDVSINTVSALLVNAGLVCATFHDETVRGVQSKRVECDEIWAFCGAKEKRTTPEQKAAGWGDVWTWTALDANSKLLVSFLVGDRGPHNCYEFMKDVASRLASKVQLTTDGLTWYVDAVDHAFGIDIDYAMIQKHYAGGIAGERTAAARYSPAKFTSATKEVIRATRTRSTSRPASSNVPT